MNYKVNIWQDDTLKREIVYSAENDIQAIQMASAATPDGCRSTYEQVMGNNALRKRNLRFKKRKTCCKKQVNRKTEIVTRSFEKKDHS